MSADHTRYTRASTGMSATGRGGWVGLVGRRFIRRDRTKITLIVAVAMSVAALTCVLSIMNGLQLITINNLIHIDSYHLIIQEALTAEQRAAIEARLSADSRIDSIVPFADLQTIAHSEFSELRGVSIRAVDASAAARDQRFLQQLNVIRGTFDLSENQTVLGVSLARALGVRTGDEIRIFGHSGQTHTFRIAGLFSSGYSLFDNGLAIMAIESARESINRTIPIHIGIKYHDIAAERELAGAIHTEVATIIGRPPTVSDWRQSNVAIFSALKLEKIFIIFTLGMIFIIVAINIRQSLARKVRQYASEMAILKAMGGQPDQVQRIVTYMGFYIGVVGGVAGVLVGLWLALNLNNLFVLVDGVLNSAISLINAAIFLISRDTLPLLPRISSSFFFIELIEHRLLARECVAIFLFAVAISVGAAYFASKQVAHVRPIHTLHRREE